MENQMYTLARIEAIYVVRALNTKISRIRQNIRWYERKGTDVIEKVGVKAYKSRIRIKRSQLNNSIKIRDRMMQHFNIEFEENTNTDLI